MISIEIIKNRLGITTLPSFCTYIVTWRCNCRCQMCNVWKKTKEEELTLEEIKNIFKQRKFDVIRITGGEPFLKEDLAQITDIIQEYSKPTMIHITSNGILTQRIINFFKSIKKTDNIHIKISIDAVGEKHDKLRGTAGAYNSAIKTVEELAKIKDRFNFYLAVNQIIIDKDGLKDHQQLKEICDRINVPINLQLAYNYVALYEERKNLNLMPQKSNDFPCLFNLSEKDINEILDAFQKEINNLKNWKEKLVLKYDLKGLRNRLVHNKGIPRPSCLALRSHLRILPNGDVPICLANSTVVGNLKETTLKNLWFSDELRKYREMVKKCPGCWYECEMVPSAIYSGDIFKALFYSNARENSFLQRRRMRER